MEHALLEGPWTRVRDEVDAQLIPIPGAAALLDQLDITIPAHLEWNAECSADFVRA